MAKVMMSTGDIKQPYTIIDTVFAYGSSDQAMFKTSNPMEAYTKVAELLRNRADGLGGDAIVYATFDYRVAVKQGCAGAGQSFEVFGYGTAVKLG